MFCETALPENFQGLIVILGIFIENVIVFFEWSNDSVVFYSLELLGLFHHVLVAVL